MSENLNQVAAFSSCGAGDPAPACGTACGAADASLLAALRIRNRLAVRLILRPPAVLPTRSPHVVRLIQLPLAALHVARLTLSRQREKRGVRNGCANMHAENEACWNVGDGNRR